MKAFPGDRTDKLRQSTGCHHVARLTLTPPGPHHVHGEEWQEKQNPESTVA